MGRRRKGDAVSGWINLDKGYDLTSTHAVSRIRRLFNAQKAGHAGTLDPLATGILPIALGEATKTVPFLMDADKGYRFTIAWGRTTATYDREGATIASSDARPRPAEVEVVLPRFVGQIEQVPPAYSAIKVDGERAYDLARAGETVELKARQVVIHAARVAEAPDPDHVTLEIECGKGTYVRALVRDIADALGACGHVSELRRTRVGRFGQESAVTLELLEDLGHKARLLEALLPVETALDDIPALAVTDEDAFRLKQGRSIVLVPRQVEAVKARLKPGSRTVSAMAGGSVVALCEMRAGRLEPSRVFHLEKSGEQPDVDYGRTQG
ncbi:tRNA pseudouridine(55) synthase TruB [Phenylobacterium sp.]|jgi:tRNA pseudouridine55 synthase|uniref:tRNA pseudouridine(55) synthase TruB n=1 Tax=Phenylobacterium sp. TaxID=1871053 RepID=UPI002F9316D0